MFHSIIKFTSEYSLERVQSFGVQVILEKSELLTDLYAIETD